MSEYYVASGAPSTAAALASATMRAEFALISAGFDKLPTLAGNGSKAVVINAGGTAMSVTTGTLTLAGNFATSGANSLTLTTTGATNVTLPTSGTLASTASKLSAFAATTSAELAGVISDETGSGALVFANTPTLVTPVIGAATGTSLAVSGALSGATVAASGALTALTVNGLTLSTSTGTITITNGKTLSASNTLTLAGTDGTTMTFPPVSASVGYLNIPQNAQIADYTAVAADAGGGIHHPAADTNARTFTIPANASVAYPVGTAITFTNETANVVTIAITSDTLVLAGTTTTGSRSLAQNGMATAYKVTTTKWFISGAGLS